MTLLFLLLTLICLLSPLYIDEKLKTVIYIFQMLASIAAGVFGSIVTDRYKEITGNTILWKKGISAVRGLALIRNKSRNIIIRIKSNNNINETINLIDLLEKDIANVSREWEDIIPGITKDIDSKYDALTDKEIELAQAVNDKELIESKLIETKQSDQQKTAELNKLKLEHSKKITNLQNQIASLENKAASISTSSFFESHISTGGAVFAGISSATNKSICKQCLATYESPGILSVGGLCPSCVTLLELSKLD